MTKAKVRVGGQREQVRRPHPQARHVKMWESVWVDEVWAEGTELNGVTFVNLTPHAITVRLPSDDDVPSEEYVFPPSGQVMRAREEREGLLPVGGIPVQGLIRGDAYLPATGGAPFRIPGVVYIVSAMCLGRDDYVAPDTGRAIRDANGNIVAVPGFVQ